MIAVVIQFMEYFTLSFCFSSLLEDTYDKKRRPPYPAKRTSMSFTT